MVTQRKGRSGTNTSKAASKRCKHNKKSNEKTIDNENTNAKSTKTTGTNSNINSPLVTITTGSPGASSLRAQYFNSIKKTPSSTSSSPSAKPDVNSAFTFPSKIPKTTNKTAGITPYPHDLKRRLEFPEASANPTSPKRKVKQTGFVDHTQSIKMNKLWYELLPDGVIYAFAAKGKPNGERGYTGFAFTHLSAGLNDEDNEYHKVARNACIMSCLPLKDPLTLKAQTYSYTHQDGRQITVDVRGFVYMHDDPTMNNHPNAQAWCRNLVKVLNANWNCKLHYGGSAAQYGLPAAESLDQVFLTSDVANLAWNAYEDTLRDGTFWDDTDLVQNYFANTPNARALIEDMFPIH